MGTGVGWLAMIRGSNLFWNFFWLVLMSEIEASRWDSSGASYLWGSNQTRKHIYIPGSSKGCWMDGEGCLYTIPSCSNNTLWKMLVHVPKPSQTTPPQKKNILNEWEFLCLLKSCRFVVDLRFVRCQKFDAPGWVSFVGNTRQVLRHSASDNLLIDFLGGHKNVERKWNLSKVLNVGRDFFQQTRSVNYSWVVELSIYISVSFYFRFNYYTPKV